MKKAAFILAVVFISTIASAQVKEKRDVDNFTGISFGVAGELNLVQGAGFSVTIEGSKNFLDEVETYVKGGTLIIRRKNWTGWNNEKVTVWVTMPEIENIGLSGSGILKAEGTITSNELDLSVSGSGKMNLLDLKVDELDCSISGSGAINLEGGTASECDLSISGSGKYRGRDFQVSEMTVSISGSGNCECNVSKDLEARVSGSGDIYYTGPASVDARISGSGKVRKL